ncbi:hypothetical protein D3C74_295660 [compost metagenome]
MSELTAGGTTLLLVSHSIDQVRSVCKNAIWLKKGQVMAAGLVDDVCNAYLGG